MEKEKQHRLFDQFNSPSEEEWFSIAQKEINKQDLSWTNYENLSLQPIYTAKTLQGVSTFRNFQHNKGGGKPGWLLVEQVEVSNEKEANIQALNALQGGVDGIEFIIQKDKISIPNLLKGIWTDNCVIALNLQHPSLVVVEEFLNQYRSEEKSPLDLRGWISFDPLKEWLIKGKENLQFSSEMKNLFKLTQDYPNFIPLTINSHHIGNCGGSIIHELSSLLAVTVEYLEILKREGIESKEALTRILYSLTVSTNFFFEISKLRAFRVLICKIAKAYNIELLASEVRIHTKTSLWNKSYIDSYNNIIRNTAEGLAAIIGGTDYLSISNLSATSPSEETTNRRASRNISHILKEEAYLDKVLDPAAGSYYIETLTEKLQNSVWTEFLTIENSGGFIQAIKKGIIPSKINQLREEKIENIDLRKELLIGVNIYPNLKEEIKQASPESEINGLVHEKRASQGIEDLRRWVETEFNSEEKDRSKTLIANFAETEINKSALALLKNVFSSAGFIVVVNKDKGIPEQELGKYNLIIAFVDKESNEENTYSVLKNLSKSIPIAITSEKSITLDKEFAQVYKPVEELVLHHNLKRILSHLVAKKK